MAMEPTVSIRGVDHAFGEAGNRKQVLFDVNLDLYPGEIVILTGPSGSGKTTLLTLIGALRSIQQGSIRINGREIAGMSSGECVELRKGVGFIFQAHNLFDSLTAMQNVQMAAQLGGRDPVHRKRLVREILVRVGLADRIDHKPRALSGGQRQRVAIARALVNRPRLVLADEPTAALDKQNGEKIIRLFQELALEEGCTILIVTHDPRILDSASRIVNFVDGRVVSNVQVERCIEICEFLAKTSVFAGHTPASLMEVAEKAGTERHPAGTKVFRQGEAGDRFYLIRSGRVSVIVEEDGASRVVATLGTGDVFGEAALIEDKPRNATIRVEDDAELYTLDRAAFRAALDSSKSFREQLLELLAQRR